MTSPFEFPVTVYYEDTDCTGLVYHAKYLNFMERARSAWLASLGFSLSKMHEAGKVIVVHSLQINYCQPAKLHNQLIVKTEMVEMGKASMLFKQEIYLDNKVVCVANIKLACVATNSKPCALPELLKDLLK